VARSHAVALALFVAGPACAQVSGSVTLLSDDVYRGQSLSDGKPNAQLALAWDRGDGWYAGVLLSRVRFADPDSRVRLRAVPYVGHVRVLRPGLSAEAGVQYNRFSPSGHYDFAEFYVGLSGERLRTRLSWMPQYFGQTAAWYAEINGDHPLRGRLRAVGHVGALQLRHPGGYSQRTNSWRTDAAAGLAIDLAGFEAQATWNKSGGGYDSAICEPSRCRARDGWVLRLSRSW
jgi:uncharacterized protein (TIGR02001 family)